MEREDKLKMTCSPEQLAEILRSMADAMEQGRLSLENVDVEWNEVEKIALSVRNAAGMADVKIRISSSHGAVELPEDVDEDLVEDELGQDQVGELVEAQPRSKRGKPRGGYGSLKKRMKQSFKTIIYALHEQTWPPMAVIDEFLRDSADMVLYPGKGDEFYPAYSEAVADFAQAVQKQDLEAAFEAAHLLNTLKTRCHKKYD